MAAPKKKTRGINPGFSDESYFFTCLGVFCVFHIYRTYVRKTTYSYIPEKKDPTIKIFLLLIALLDIKLNVCKSQATKLQQEND